MKYILIIMAVVASLASLSIFAHSRGDSDSGHFGKIQHIMKKLDVTDAQKHEIKEIVKTTKSQIDPVKEQSKEIRSSLRELMHSSDYDESKVADLADKQGLLMAQSIKIMADTKSRIYAQLTPEQQEKFNKFQEKRSKHKGKSRDRRKWIE